MILRCLLAGLCLLLTLPLLITFDSLVMWKVTLLVSEYGHRLALLPLLLALWSLRRHDAVGLGLSVITLGVLLSPLALGIYKARTLPGELQEAFGLKERPDDEVLNLKQLWLGRAPTVLPPEIHVLPERDGSAARRILFLRAAQPKAGAPCLVVIHGGGWKNGRPEEFAEWNQYWALQGYAVASVEYRLAPQWRWPAPLEDVTDALHYLKAHAGDLGIAQDNFVLVGRSAGGQIATAAAYGLHDPAIRGCVSLYAPADMVFAMRFADPHDLLDSLTLIDQYMGGKPETLMPAYISASGTLLANAKSPPTLIVHGRRDTLVWYLQSQRLNVELQRQGVPHYFLDIPWGAHALDYPFHGPSGQLTRYAMGVFLRDVTGR